MARHRPTAQPPGTRRDLPSWGRDAPATDTEVTMGTIARHAHRTDPRGTGRPGGFTFVEVLVTTIVLGLLTALVIPSFLGTRDRANGATAESLLRVGATAVETASVGARRLRRPDDRRAAGPRARRHLDGGSRRGRHRGRDHPQRRERQRLHPHHHRRLRGRLHPREGPHVPADRHADLRSGLHLVTRCPPGRVVGVRGPRPVSAPPAEQDQPNQAATEQKKKLIDVITIITKVAVCKSVDMKDGKDRSTWEQIFIT